jgi:hypothetical protein
VGLRTGLDSVENEKISYPCRELNPNSSAVLRVARLFTVFFVRKFWWNMLLLSSAMKTDAAGASEMLVPTY